MNPERLIMTWPLKPRMILLVILAGLLVMSCGDVSGPSVFTGYDGWVVGNSIGGYAMILHTTNSGDTWTRQGTAASIPDVPLNAVRAVDSLQAWACGAPSDGYATIMRTNDAGETWERVGNAGDIPNEGLLSASLLTADDVWMCGSGNTIIHTTDGGATWTDMSDPAYWDYWFEGIFALDASHIWACGGETSVDNGILIHSSDGGITWTAQGDSILLAGYPLLSISAWDANHAWVVGHGYTYARTVDGGVNWELCLPDSLTRSTQGWDANGVTAVSQTDVWTCQDYGRVFLTTDGGDNWTEQNVPGDASGCLILRICAFDLSNVWAVGQGPIGGIIIVNVDGGSWVVQPSPASNGLFDVSFAGSHH
jgi:photosystem II stability/assembly factor-like uncharacterized protein